MSDQVKVSELFDAVYGTNLELVHLTQCKFNAENSIPFVSRTEKNNGLSAYVKKLPDIKANPAHTLSVAVSGSVLSTFYQPNPYYSGRDLYVLIPKRKTSVIEMLFYAKCIESNRYKYNYGRAANKTLREILVPAKISDEFYQHLYIYHETLLKKISIAPHINENFKLFSASWKEFNLSCLFEIKGSLTTPKLELEEIGEGPIPYVTTQSTDNGVAGFFAMFTEDGEVLTIDSAVLGYCSYQKLPFSASDHVEKMVPKFPINESIAMFLVTVLNKEQYRYNYGRKCSQTRLRSSKIKLPATEDGNPDFEFMERYIKSIPYSVNLE